MKHAGPLGKAGSTAGDGPVALNYALPYDPVDWERRLAEARGRREAALSDRTGVLPLPLAAPRAMALPALPAATALFGTGMLTGIALAALALWPSAPLPSVETAGLTVPTATPLPAPDAPMAAQNHPTPPPGLPRAPEAAMRATAPEPLPPQATADLALPRAPGPSHAPGIDPAQIRSLVEAAVAESSRH